MAKRKDSSSTKSKKKKAKKAKKTEKEATDLHTTTTTKDLTSNVSSDGEIDAKKNIQKSDDVEVAEDGIKAETMAKKKKKKTKKSASTIKESQDSPDKETRREASQIEQPTVDVVSKGITENNSEDESSQDEEDQELLAAAALWAQEGDDEEGEETRNSLKEESSRRPKNLSLHITQLPFDCIELDLRRIFAEEGCAVTSVRLVYDRDTLGRKTVFRGVAFVDCLDEASYQKALSNLNRKATIRGRKLNVRPTRSKEELADIVSRTRELVQEKIRSQREANSNTKGDDKTDSLLSKKQKKKEKKERAKAKVAKAQTKPVKHKVKEKSEKGPTKEGKKADGKDRKLTKKERNRKAAIIMGLRRQKK